MNDENNRLDHLRRMRFDVEHSLSLYAYSYVHLPAVGIYDEESLKPHLDTIKSCHIYFIGYIPRVSILGAEQTNRTVSIHLECGRERKSTTWDLPDGFNLKEVDGRWFVEDRDGQRYAATDDQVLVRLAQQHTPLTFDVKYIGQAYGRDGSRSAYDRLLGHEKLQEIALRQAPEGHVIALLMVAVQPNTQIFTIFNPRAQELEHGRSRILAGIEKLYGTTERERVAVYKAAMIRYFKPQFNIEFKDSFPSTSLKILQDCYAKDFSTVIAEFCFEDTPFLLRSESVGALEHHIAQYDLHSEEDRRAFFRMLPHDGT
jgi:hypothetical protein